MTKNLALKASVLAMGLGLSAYASAGNIVQVDFTGSGSAGSAVLADNLDWNQGNIMFQGAILASGAPTTMTLYGQATGIFKSGSTGLNPAGYEVTYIFSLPVDVSKTTSGTVDTYTYANTASGSGSFKAFISGKQAGGVAADNAAGTGFNDGVLIFSGTFNESAATNDLKNTRTCLTSGPACKQLNIFDDSDGSVGGVTVAATIRTTIFSGNAAFTVNITSQNSSYILNNINSFNVDFEDMTFNTSTFTQYADVSTSKQLRNSTDTGFVSPVYGKVGALTINGSCSVGTCDAMVEADASSAFDAGPPLPEPGTLALLALGLTGFGAMARRRKAK